MRRLPTAVRTWPIKALMKPTAALPSRMLPGRLRSVEEPHDPPLLGLVGGDRVVAGHLPAVGVEATVRPLHLEPGADHRTVDVKREPVPAGPPQRVRDQLLVELREALDVLSEDLLHPALSVRGDGKMESPTKRARSGSACS